MPNTITYPSNYIGGVPPSEITVNPPLKVNESSLFYILKDTVNDTISYGGTSTTVNYPTDQTIGTSISNPVNLLSDLALTMSNLAAEITAYQTAITNLTNVDTALASTAPFQLAYDNSYLAQYNANKMYKLMKEGLYMCFRLRRLVQVITSVSTNHAPPIGMYPSDYNEYLTNMSI